MSDNGFNTLGHEIMCVEPEDALDTIVEWFELELLEGCERVTLRAITADVDPVAYGCKADPLWKHGSDKIFRVVAVEEVEEVRKRWTAMSRAITSVSIY